MMRELGQALVQINYWQQQGYAVAMATVVRTWGSAPRLPGAKMLVASSGEVWGSVSAGCVESAVVEAAQAVLITGQPRLLHFGVVDDMAWDVGLMCGGEIDIFVAPLSLVWGAVLEPLLTAETPFTWLTLIQGPAQLVGKGALVQAHEWVYADLPDELVEQGLVQATKAEECYVVQQGSLSWLVQHVYAPASLIIVGGNHIGVALAELAKLLHYRVVVVDPRTTFANEQRFPQADQILDCWPDQAFATLDIHERCAVAVLTHDPRLDDPALLGALQSDAFYIGALGSRRTQQQRRERLLEQGCTPQQLAQIHGPIGLDIGAKTPEEIALAVMSEVVLYARKGHAGA